MSSEITWLETIPEPHPDNALACALRYLMAARNGFATDDHARLFGLAQQTARALGATPAEITQAVRGA